MQAGQHHQQDMMSSSGTPSAGGISSDEDGSMDIKPPVSERGSAGRGQGGAKGSSMDGGKKTKGRVKIKMEFIDNKLRRYTTFSKRKTGIMKKVNRKKNTTKIIIANVGFIRPKVGLVLVF